MRNKTIFITGASRGIGEAIAYRFAKEGANVVIAAKTAEPNPKLPGTIFTVAQQVESLGGKALPIALDVREEDHVEQAVAKAVETFGGIDVLINNASAIFPAGTLETPIKRFDLMMQCNFRAVFVCSKACIPHLKKSTNPHILNLSPPLNMDAKWFKNHVAYTISKYGMSLCTLGMAEEFREEGIAVNSLWPRTTIATKAIETFFPFLVERSRLPTIVADAAYAIIKEPSRSTTGQFFIDEEVLKKVGVEDFEAYAHSPGKPLQVDLFLEPSNNS